MPVNKGVASRIAWSTFRVITVGSLLAGAVAALGLIVAVFPLTEVARGDEKWEWGFMYAGWGIAVVVAARLAWAAAGSVRKRVLIFLLIGVLAAAVSIVLFYGSVLVACEAYDDCLSN